MLYRVSCIFKSIGIVMRTEFVFQRVDAFWEGKFTSGNPAAICIVEEFPEDKVMQELAHDIGFSNIAFLVQRCTSLPIDDFNIRWFTPLSEAPLCGHATLAAAAMLMQRDDCNSDKMYFRSKKHGAISVFRDLDLYRIQMPSFTNKKVEMSYELSDLLEGVDVINIVESNNMLIVHVRDEKTLKSFVPNRELLMKLPYRSFTTTARGDTFHDFKSRYFAPKVGIEEDHACASSHCSLIPYWYNLLGKPQMKAFQLSKRGAIIRCEQAFGRPLVMILGKALIREKFSIYKDI